MDGRVFLSPFPESERPNKMNSPETLVIIFWDPNPFDKRNRFLNEKGAKRFIPSLFIIAASARKLQFNCILWDGGWSAMKYEITQLAKKELLVAVRINSGSPGVSKSSPFSLDQLLRDVVV